VIETFETSTRVAKVSTDQGTGFLKGMGNPSGNASLASELVAAELAIQIGLKVPEFAVVEVNDLDIPMQGHGFMDRGPAFVSRTVDGFVGDGTKDFVLRLADKSDVAKLVLFDTWVRNGDRCPPEESFAEPNRDNLFFTGSGRRLSLVALDHSHAFVEGELELEIGTAGVISDQRIYGLFPEFAGAILEADILVAAREIGRIEAAEVREIVGSVPRQWGLTVGARAAWVDMITSRAKLVAETGPDRLLLQMRFNFEEGA
jgi:hypothetical protein